ncbi:alpha-E domain-containing protein [Agaribacterium sp. ZY112]|uniref:alpha-E domain-containing protein n=1 Tax=Agaribacterium sp. ZY112 TaxID=3233574 RepID=UPI003524029E
MLLSRVAERAYWAGRYLERVQSTARLISIYDKLLFDLPRSIKLSWYNLVSINKLDHAFNEHYSKPDERNVMRFLINDRNNPSSMVSSIQAARENVRTTRDVFPSDVWYLINELNHYIIDNANQGITRKQRHDFLNTVIRGCQQILGVLHSDMPHDESWCFFRLGKNLERADTTSRNIDAAVAAILEIEDMDEAINSRQIIWLNLLRSLNADHYFRRAVRASINGADVVDYLICNKDFPKSVTRCLSNLVHTCSLLPKSDDITQELTDIQNSITAEYHSDLKGQPLRDYVNELQLRIINMHQKIYANWFPAWD